MKLFFEKMIMMNWGPFRNENIINYSFDEKKTVTYIFGLNSSGKTHIFEAMIWCLFNEPKIDELKEIVNKEALENQENEMYVRLKFFTTDEYGNKTDYDVKRLIKFDTIRDEKNGDILPEMIQEEFFATKNSPLQDQSITLNQNDFKKMVDNLIPIGPRKFFFLDGEKLATLFQKENLQKIESYANDLSDIHLIDKLNENLDLLYSSLNSKQPIKNSEKIEAQKRRLDSEKSKLVTANQRKEQLLLQLKDANELEYNLKRECEKFDELKPRIDKIKQLEAKKKQQEAIKKEQFSSLKENLNSNLPILFVENEIKWCIDCLIELDKQGKIPPKRTPPEVLELILADPEEKCICGRKITDHIREEFLKIQKIIPDSKFNREVQDFRRDLIRSFSEIHEKKAIIKKKMGDIQQKNILINRVDHEIVVERKFLVPGQEKEFDKINEKFTRWNQLKDEIRDIDSNLEHIDNFIIAQKRTVTTEKERLESLYKKDEKFEKIGKQIEFISYCETIIENVKQEVTRTIIKFVSGNTSDQFKQLIWDPKNWDKIDFNENWKIDALTSNHRRINCDRLSQGQRHVLGIAFMSSLGKVTGNFIPFTFDSPFGRVSEEPIENIGKNLPKLMEGRQVILFVTDTEDSHIKPHIKSIIGNQYVINKISGTESEIKVG